MASAASFTLLVVEDNRVLSSLVKRSLERISSNVNFVVARNGKEGLEAARRHTPSLVVLDLLMPECDGYFFLDGQAEDVVLREVPVLLHTSIKENELTEKIEQYPAVKGYIPKPISPTDLINKLSDFLSAPPTEPAQ